MHYCFLAEYSANKFLEGTNLIVFELAKELIARGDSVTILSPFWNPVGEEDKKAWTSQGIELCFFKAPFVFNPISRTLFYFINGFLLSLSKKFDVFFGAYTLPPCLATIWLGMLFGKKRFVAIWEEGACNSVKSYWFFKPFYSHATAIQTLSGSIKELFIKNSGIAREKVRVVYGFADLDSFKPAPKSKMLMKKFGIKEKDFVFLSVGRVSELKGSVYSIQAIAKVNNAKLLFVGRVIDEPYYNKLAKELNVADRVIFAGYTHEKLLPYFNLCDCFVLPSLSEGFALVFAEAFACGKPAIASNHGPLPEVIGNAGLIVPMRDSEALAAAMNQIMNDNKKRKELSKNALERAKEFEKGKIIRQFADLLHE